MSPSNRCFTLMFALSLVVFVESRAFALGSDDRRARVEAKTPSKPTDSDSKISFLPPSVMAKTISYLNLQELLDVALVSSSMKAAARVSEQTALALESDGNLPKIDFATRFPRLKSFRIRHATLDADDLNRLAAIKTLTELDLSEVRFQETGPEKGINSYLCLQQPFPELLIFKVNNLKDVSETHMLPLLQLPSFHSIVFPKLKKFIVQGLEDYNNLVHLLEDSGTRESLEEVVVDNLLYSDDRDISQLGKLKNMRVLRLRNSGSPSELPILGLGALSSLTHLEIGGLFLAEEDLTQLSRLENLTELSLITFRTSHLDAVGVVKGLTSLKWESFDRGTISPELSIVEKFPALRSLEIKSARMNSFDAKLPSTLEEFHFFTSEPKQLGDLKMLPELRTLGVECASPEALPNSLGQIFPKLSLLSLKHCRVGKEAARSLNGLTDLRLVTYTPNEDLLGMSPLPNLEALSITSQVRISLPTVSLGKKYLPNSKVPIPLTTVLLGKYFPNLRHLTLMSVRMDFTHLVESAVSLRNSLEFLEVLDSTLTGKVNLRFGQLTKLQGLNLQGTTPSNPDSVAVLEDLGGWEGMTQLKEVHFGSVFEGSINPRTVLLQKGLSIEYDVLD